MWGIPFASYLFLLFFFLADHIFNVGYQLDVGDSSLLRYLFKRYRLLCFWPIFRYSSNHIFGFSKFSFFLWLSYRAISLSTFIKSRTTAPFNTTFDFLISTSSILFVSSLRLILSKIT